MKMSLPAAELPVAPPASWADRAPAATIPNAVKTATRTNQVFMLSPQKPDSIVCRGIFGCQVPGGERAFLEASRRWCGDDPFGKLRGHFYSANTSRRTAEA